MYELPFALMMWLFSMLFAGWFYP